MYIHIANIILKHTNLNTRHINKQHHDKQNTQMQQQHISTTTQIKHIKTKHNQIKTQTNTLIGHKTQSKHLQAKHNKQ